VKSQTIRQKKALSEAPSFVSRLNRKSHGSLSKYTTYSDAQAILLLEKTGLIEYNFGVVDSL
jgi:DNA primase